MSHLDELDEFEAELELRLKREYTAVFGLFSIASSPRTRPTSATSSTSRSSPSRTTRSSTCAWRTSGSGTRTGRPGSSRGQRCWTASDVTVEELRADGDEPSLTAEALAEKIGESLSADDDL